MLELAFAIISIVGALFLFFTLEAKFLFGVIRVSGKSMLPTLKDDDVLLVRRVYAFEKPEVNKMYTYHKNNRRVVKRLKKVTKVCGQTVCWFEGDNPPMSYDSRQYGYIRWKSVERKVIKKIA